MGASPFGRWVLLAGLIATWAGCGSGSHKDPLLEGPGRDGLRGWNILADTWDVDDPNDAMSFEWDYFMIHDAAGRFTGSIGYLIANPRDAGGLGELVPKGGNVAVAGLFDEGALAEYVNFGLQGFSASGSERAFSAAAEGGLTGAMLPQAAADGDPGRLGLTGRSESFAWDLEVSQDWPGLSEAEDCFHPMTGTDVGELFPDSEIWNVDMLWPRTRVTGSLTRLDTDETLAVDGHGYRENSWGRWAFNMGGWDFAVVSDADARVLFAWQSYHHRSEALDYLDLAFIEGGQLRTIQFKAARGELGWEHPDWIYDAAARQCMPASTRVVADNGTYRVEAQADLEGRQAPMLSDLTAATRGFVIEIQFPLVSGTITRSDTGEVLATFAGQGGGEFAVARRDEQAEVPDAEECRSWGQQFASPLP